LEASYEEKFLAEIPAKFVDHIEALRVLTSLLLTEVRLRTEEFFKTRKACPGKVFTACSSNFRADLLLKSTPFSALLFEQSVVDTILAELRTADKDPGSAFGKKPFPNKG